MSLARIALVAAMLAVPPVHAAIAQAPAVARTRLEGVWDNVVPTGRAVYHGNIYFLLRTIPDSAATSSPSSEADQARMFRTMAAQTGTFTIEDTIVTMTPTYLKNPRPAAMRPWKWYLTIKGDTLTWRALNAQGKVTETGVAIRVSR
jgi:hypothetical protein